MKIHSVGAELFHTDGRTQTDVTKLIVAIRNFANEPKNGTNAVSAVRRETLALTISVPSPHGPVH
jgi:hypothetical protein